MNRIKLGYEVGTGNQVMIPLSHLIVCGVSQLSGKTTTLEALIKRSNLRAIVFKTKIGEKSFGGGGTTLPFFRDRSDYEFVKSLIEAYAKEKLFLEKGTLMELCKGSGSLLEIKKKVDEALLNEKKMRGIVREIHIRLQHYLENLIPQIRYANLSRVLLLHEGINIMDLEQFTEEAQSLIIQSVLDEVLKNHRDVIVVIPEAWKFIPQRYNNPCKRSVERFIRQGAANNNFIWTDSQDMANVDKALLKQVSTWILGYQAEINEVKHTLDQISLPKKSKPTEHDVMTLRKGYFILSSYDGVKKVYVQPLWLSDEQAVAVAKGEQRIEQVKVPEVEKEEEEDMYDDTGIRNEIAGIKTRLSELQTKFVQTKIAQSPGINEEELIGKILQRIPAAGHQTFVVAPLEKIKKDFLEVAKKHVLGEIEKLDAEQKKILKFVEVQGKGCNIPFILDHCLHRSATSGGNKSAISAKTTAMVDLVLVRKDKNSVIYPHLKEFIKTYLTPHGATDAEVQQVYDHVMVGLI